jgi:hypothetical protein
LGAGVEHAFCGLIDGVGKDLISFH